jgi:hypothetical protein
MADLMIGIGLKKFLVRLFFNQWSTILDLTEVVKSSVNIFIPLALLFPNMLF